MQEKLLHYIWQYKLYQTPLKDTNQQTIQVIHPGYYNRDAGPDFFKAQLKINDTLWVGNVEIHVKTSDWEKHGHQHDEKYQHIILHVVYEHDTGLKSINAPTLVLKDYISEEILYRYEHKFIHQHQIPCSNQLHHIDPLIIDLWLERLFIERIERKNLQWHQLLVDLQHDWLQLTFIRLMHNMGFKINETAMHHLAQTIPVSILQHIRHDLHQTEALLLGQAGLLENLENRDDYTNELEKTFHFLRRKYDLTPIKSSMWNMLRLRPVNFPAIRLAQMAYLIHHHFELFNSILYEDINSIAKQLNTVKTSSYWDMHYVLGKESVIKKKELGKQSVENIMINTVIPSQLLYAQEQHLNYDPNRYIQYFSTLPAEKNNIILEWGKLGIQAKNSAQSQALIELYNSYCKNKRCLECTIGNKILKIH